MKGLWLSDPFCVKAPAGDVSRRTCHSLIRKAGVEEEAREKKSQSGNCPPSIKFTLWTHTHTHKDTLSYTCVLWFTPAISTSDHWPCIVWIMETLLLNLTGVRISRSRLCLQILFWQRGFNHSARKSFVCCSLHMDHWGRCIGLMTAWSRHYKMPSRGI